MSFLAQFPELTPAMRSVLQGMARARHRPLYEMSPQEARAAYEAGAGVLELPRPELARVEELRIPTRDGAAIPARLYAPSHDALPVLVYFHGGGFTIGSVDSHDTLCRTLARGAACAVVSVGYRLAPEHRFPTAVNDAWDATQWVARAPLRLDAARIAVGGDSAGGTLATVCATLARDAGLALRLQLLFYPGCAARQESPSHRRYHEGLILEQAHIEYFFGQYVDDAERDDWRFAPLETPDLEGVAPAWFGLAECDPMVDDAIRYADTLRSAGVPVDLEIYRGVTHEFIKMGRVLPEARQAHADARGGPATRIRGMNREDFRFLHRLRVRWAEVDMQKIVFNAHYLMYFDTAIADYWRVLALPYEEGMRQLEGDLYVKKATVEFNASARMDDRLDVGMKCSRIGNSSILFTGAIFRGEELLITCELLYVFADPATQKSKPVPAALREMLTGYEAGEAMLHVKTGSWAELGADAGRLRTEVFVQEQRIPAELEWDEADANCVHAVGYNRLGQPVATGRLLPSEAGVARIGRMAVHQVLRGCGFGERILRALAAQAQARGDGSIELHAQRTAANFYARLGFRPQGAPYEEAGIPHITMTRPLPMEH